MQMAAINLSDIQLNNLQRSIINAAREFYGLDPTAALLPKSAKEAAELLDKVARFRLPVRNFYSNVDLSECQATRGSERRSNESKGAT